MERSDRSATRTPAENLARGLVATGLTGLAVTLAWSLLVRGQDDTGSIRTIQGPAAPVEIAESAPDFRLPELGDKNHTIALSSLRGDIVVLNFWASWCLPCRQEAPGLQAASERYRDDGVRFLGVDVLDDEAAAQAFQSEFQITYPSVFDPAGSLADDYGYFGLPATYVIDAEGVMRYRFAGYVTEQALDRALRTLLRRATGDT